MPPANSASSPRDVTTLLTGSGEVLIAARALALAKWVPAAKVPPSRPKAICSAPPWSPITAAASAAPAGMRMKVWAASQRESSQGSLSAKNSTSSSRPDTPSTSGWASTLRPPGRCTPAKRASAPSTNTNA